MVKVQQVIISDIRTTGDGKDFPIRALKEIYDFDGILIAVHDPLSYPIEVIIGFVQENSGREFGYKHFTEWINKKGF